MFLLSFPSWKILTLQFLVFCFSLLNRAKLLPVEPGGVCCPLVGSCGITTSRIRTPSPTLITSHLKSRPVL